MKSIGVSDKVKVSITLKFKYISMSYKTVQQNVQFVYDLHLHSH